MTDEPRRSGDDYLWDGSGEPDAEIERLEKSLGSLRYRPPSMPRALVRPQNDAARESLPEPSPVSLRRMRRARISYGLAIAATFIFAVGMATWALRRPAPNARVATVAGADRSSSASSPSSASSAVIDGPSWDVARVEGAPRIGEAPIADKGKLGVGSWLSTDEVSRASITVADIGNVDVDRDTRVRLVQTGTTQHRLDLDHGTLHARVVAPPRLFVIGTPSASAVDLGCAYSLSVDAKTGEGTLHVTSGWVSLETPTRSSMVPRGASCHTRKGYGPGTPYFDDAPEPFRDALRHFDFDDDGVRLLPEILAAARKRDSLTLWHLLSRVDNAHRNAVYMRLAQISPPPGGVGEPEAMRLDRTALEVWKSEMVTHW